MGISRRAFGFASFLALAPSRPPIQPRTANAMLGFGGRLTLLSAQPVMRADAIGKTQLFYAPDQHDTIPVLNSGVWTEASFLANSGDNVGWSLTPTLAANTSYHIAALASGLVLKPWTSTPTRYQGRHIFADDLSTWLGSISADANAQLTQHVTGGEYRRGAVWNRYNQQGVRLIAGNPTIAAYQQYTAPVGWAPIAAGYEAKPFTGEATSIAIDLRQTDNTAAPPVPDLSVPGASTWGQFAVGWNSTSIPSGYWGTSGLDFGIVAGGNLNGPGQSVAAMHHVADAIGLNTAIALHSPYVLNGGKLTVWSGMRSRYMVVEYQG